MSKVKHVMVSYGENLTGEQTTVCGRMVNENGQGADCKQCAARVARNQATITAMIPTGNGLVCICDDVWADTSKVEPGTRVVCPVDGTTFEREAAPVEAHGVQVEACTLDNGDTVYVGKCEHGWQTGFHYTRGDAHDVAAGHGEVTRALYAPPVAVEAITGDVFDEIVATAQKAIADNGRVFLAEAHNFGGRAAFDALVASGWADLINDGDMSRYVRGETVIGRRAWGPNGLQGTIESTYSDGSVNLVTFGKSNIIPAGQWKLMKATPTPTVDDVAAMADTENWFNKIVELSEQTIKAEIEEPTPPAIPGYYWARHNGHTSVENGPTVRTTDTYQLIKDGTTCQVAATISHVSGFRWRPSGCVWINTGLSSGWDGVPLVDAFARVQTYMREVAHVRATDPTDHHARMRAGDVARSGQPFISAHEVRLIADTPSKAPVVAVGEVSKPTRTKLAKRARKALSRKHKPSKVHRG